MEIKELEYNTLGGIDGILVHPVFGEIPYTLTEEDIASIPEGTYIKPYEEPEDAGA